MKMLKRVAPLPKSFMLASILGFLISAYLITDVSWKFTFLIVFATMFIASYISMMKAPALLRAKKK